MAVTITVPNLFKTELGKGTIDFRSDVFHIILMASGWTIDPDSDGTYADISANEIGVTGPYVLGGYLLVTDSAWAQNNTNDTAELTWDDHIFEAVSAEMDEACAAVIVRLANGSTIQTTDLVVGSIDFGQNVTLGIAATLQLQDLGYTEM